MLKYYNTMVVFEELPDEVTLAINISNCPCRCNGCHSQFLWDDVGTYLTFDKLDKLIKKNDGITCVCFMGGDSDPKYVNELAKYVSYTKSLKCGWYSGKDNLSEDIDLENFLYIKIGHYDKNFGGLNNENTNQRLYYIEEDQKGDNYFLKDITYKFWKNKARF